MKLAAQVSVVHNILSIMMETGGALRYRSDLSFDEKKGIWRGVSPSRQPQTAILDINVRHVPMNLYFKGKQLEMPVLRGMERRTLHYIRHNKYHPRHNRTGFGLLGWTDA